MKECPVCGDTINDNDTSLSIVECILLERKRQDAKWGANRNLDNLLWNAILGEEQGEVSKAILEHDSHLKEELIQVAAVAVAWLECIERNSRGRIL